jgi:hypothetical protein
LPLSRINVIFSPQIVNGSGAPVIWLDQVTGYQYPRNPAPAAS